MAVIAQGWRFTVDDLFTLPDWGVRGEVLDGRLVLAPPPARRHVRVTGNLAGRLRLVAPDDVAVRRDTPVRMPDGDGPVPDLIVTSGRERDRSFRAGQVHTVVEVVSADGRFIDRVWKLRRYEEAGIPCYWRVELAAWPGYRGSLPLVTVRVREPAGWRECVAAAGRLHALPLAYGRDPDGSAACVRVWLDPGTLPVRYANAR
jgi:Uma2 family endonuclease